MKGQLLAVLVVAVAIGLTVDAYLLYVFPGGQAAPQTRQLTSLQTTLQTTLQTSQEFSTCTGYPPGGDCPGVYNYTFIVELNYSGPWRLTYNGTNNVGEADSYAFTRTVNGTGYDSFSVPLSGMNNKELGICAYAQKLDGSNSTLVLTVGYSQQTSKPFGSTTMCLSVVP